MRIWWRMTWEVGVYIERRKQLTFHFTRFFLGVNTRHRTRRGIRKNKLYEVPHRPFLFFLFFKLLLSDKTWTKIRQKVHSSCLEVRQLHRCLLQFAQAKQRYKKYSSIYYLHISHTLEVPFKYRSNSFWHEFQIKVPTYISFLLMKYTKILVSC
jgi:hypothetical protein